MRQKERLPTPVHYQLEEEYHLESEQGLTLLNEPEDNQPPLSPLNLNNNPLLNMVFDVNAV